MLLRRLRGIIAAHVVPCTLEFMDKATINYVEDYVNIGLPRDAGSILLIEVDGHPAQVVDEAASVERVLKDSVPRRSLPRMPLKRRRSGKHAEWQSPRWPVAVPR